MTTPPRIDAPGLWHHVMNRGHNRQDIFRDDADCELFASLLEDVTGPTGIEVHSYAFMPNHFHMMVRTPSAGLAAAMQHLEAVYARRFNKKYGLGDAVYRGRYHSILIDSESHFLECPRYIDNNPVKAGIVDHPGRYRWSSYRSLAHDEPAPRFLSTDLLLPNYFNGSQLEYQAFVQRLDSPHTAEYGLIVEATDQRPVLSEAIESHRLAISRMPQTGPIALIEEFVATALRIPRHQIRDRVSGRRNEGAALAMTLLYRLNVASPTELANEYGYRSRSGVTSTIQRLEERTQWNKQLDAVLAEGLLLYAGLAA